MAGSAMTFTYDQLGTIRKVVADWTSDDTTGAVSGTTKKVTGTLVKVVTDPGSTAPTDNYDIAITDEEGVDILANSQQTLANRDTSTSEMIDTLLKNADATPIGVAAYPVVCDKLTIAVTNAGNSKTGQVILYFKCDPSDNW